ncbi:protein of unknown function (DUF3328) domain containing protein [Rhypophila sp. PSN 637]
MGDPHLSNPNLETAPFLRQKGPGSDSENNSTGDRHSEDLASTQEASPGRSHAGRLVKWAKSWHPWPALNVLISALNVAFLLVLVALAITSPSCRMGGVDQPWSPAQDSLEWEDRKLGAYVHYGSFTGPPSTPGVDAAWGDLMRGITVRLEPHELDRVSVDTAERLDWTLKLRDGSGYMVTLAVFHDLHCVKALRQSFYREHYWANLTEQQLALKAEHVEHCLEVLRQSSMCRGDVSVIPSVWEYNIRDGGDGSLLGPSIRDGRAVHRCVNWDRLHDWAKSRRVDLGITKIYWCCLRMSQVILKQAGIMS